MQSHSVVREVDLPAFRWYAGAGHHPTDDAMWIVPSPQEFGNVADLPEEFRAIAELPEQLRHGAFSEHAHGLAQYAGTRGVNLSLIDPSGQCPTIIKKGFVTDLGAFFAGSPEARDVLLNIISQFLYDVAGRLRVHKRVQLSVIWRADPDGGYELDYDGPASEFADVVKSLRKLRKP